MANSSRSEYRKMKYTAIYRKENENSKVYHREIEVEDDYWGLERMDQKAITELIDNRLFLELIVDENNRIVLDKRPVMIQGLTA